MTYDDIPRMEHERRHRAKHEPDAANRVVTAEPEWQLPPEPEHQWPAAPPDDIGTRARLYRAERGLCLICAKPLPDDGLQFFYCGGATCQHNVANEA